MFFKVLPRYFFFPASLQGNLQLPAVVIGPYGSLCLLGVFTNNQADFGISECTGLLRGNTTEKIGKYLAQGSYQLEGRQYKQSLSLCPIR